MTVKDGYNGKFQGKVKWENNRKFNNDRNSNRNFKIKCNSNC